MKDLKSFLFHFFILDFDLLSCELDNFTFDLLYLVNLSCYYIKAKKKLPYSPSS